MIRLANGLPALLLRVMLAFVLALSPLGHVLAGTDRAIPAPQEIMSCHHQDDSTQQDTGGCCHYKGSQCHCATAATLPASPLPGFSEAMSAAPVAKPVFCPQAFSIPETPPPRA